MWVAVRLWFIGYLGMYKIRNGRVEMEIKEKKKVEIIHGRGWYEGLKGKVFEVVVVGSSYVVSEDYERGYRYQWRHIDFIDTEIIK